MLESGSDKEGSGRTTESACSTLLYLLQQVNRTHLLPSMATQAPPSREMDPVNRTQAPPFMDNHPDNQTQLPPSKALDIITDKYLNIDQQTAVSTLFFIITSNYHQT